MIVLVTIGVPFILISVFFYIRLSPKWVPKKILRKYELIFSAVMALSWIALTALSYYTVGQGTESQWWPVIAFLMCLFSIPTLLIVSAIVRLIVFKNV